MVCSLEGKRIGKGLEAEYGGIDDGESAPGSVLESTCSGSDVSESWFWVVRGLVTELERVCGCDPGIAKTEGCAAAPSGYVEGWREHKEESGGDDTDRD